MLQTKNFKTIVAAMFALCMVGFYSCSSDNDDPDTPPGDEKNIIGKWEVKSPGAEYGSFEFTGDKKYIITQHVKELKSRAETNYIIIIFGDYSTVKADENNTFTLDLKEFGVITISIKDGNAEITVNGEVYTTSKAKEVNTDKQTELLCHTWNFDYTIEDGDEDDPYTEKGATFTFTNNGTYVIYHPYLSAEDIKEGIPSYEYGTWKWIDSENIEVIYTQYYYSVAPEGGESENRTEQQIVKYKIIKLNEKELVLYGEYIHEYYGWTQKNYFSR